MTRLTNDQARFIAALRRRDERAFNTLVLRYQDRVFNLVYRFLNNREEARDVAQEVFVTVFEKIDSFRGDAQLGTWIYRVASNHAKNRIKYLSRRKDRQQDSFEDMAVKPASGRLQSVPARPDEVAEGNQLSAFIGRALATLDPEQRAVVILRDVEGHPYEAIAEMTGLNLGTVKSRLHRGRVVLKAALAEYKAGRDVTLAQPSRAEERVS